MVLYVRTARVGVQPMPRIYRRVLSCIFVFFATTMHV